MQDKIKIKGAREHPAPKEALRNALAALATKTQKASLVTGQVISKT